jgi:hypothetical protein
MSVVTAEVPAAGTADVAATVARWHCLSCGLATEPIRGGHAPREAAQLAVVHDQIHHRGALTARVVITCSDRAGRR